MKKKVLHISHTDIRYDARIQKEILSLSELNFLEIFTIGISNINEYEKNYSKSGITNFAIKLFTRNYIHIKSLRYTLNLIELFFKILKIGLNVKPKVIHCHDTLVLLPSVFLKVLFNSKLIYDAHELESNKNMQTFLLSKSTLFIEKICWNHIDVLISVSDSIIKWYLNEFGYKKNLLILNTPILKNKYFGIKDNNNLREIFDISNESLIFIYVGDFCEGRGIDFILKVFADKNINSHIVFLGDGLLKNKILHFSQNFRNIHLHPLVSHDEVVGLIKSSDIGICFIENASLSDYYCLPNKLFEYVFAGLEILGSDMPEIASFINTNKVGKTCKLNHEDLKRKIKNYEKNKPKKITINLDEFSWKSQSKKLKILYKEILREKILHISHTDIRYDSRIQKEILSLSETNFLEIFTIGISNINKFEKNHINGITNFSIKLFTRNISSIRSFLYTVNLIELFFKILKIGILIKPKVIHCHDTFALLPSLLLKILINSKLIYDAHELESNKNMQTAILRKATLFIEKICWPHIDIFISVSDSIIKWYFSEFSYKKNLLVLNTPIINKNLSTINSKNDLRKIFDINKENLIFIYVGEFCMGRGIDLILKVFTDKNINSHIVFLGKGVLKDKIWNFSQRFKNIHLHNAVIHDEVVSLISSSDVGICLIEDVSLSYYFSLPNKLFEYLFAGLEILGSDIPEISNFINVNKVGKICKLNQEDLKRKIKYYEINKPKKVKINLDKFSWETQSEKLKILYKQIVN